MLPYGAVALVYGPLTRRVDAKRLAITSLAFFSIFSFLSGCAFNFPSLFLFRFLVGAFASATTPLVLIYIADHAPEARRGKSVGLFFSATFAADLLGLFLSGIVPWRAMFFIPAFLGALAALLTARYFPTSLRGRGDAASRYLAAFGHAKIRRVFGYIFVVSFLYHGVRQWLGVYFAQELGLGQFAVSMTLTVAGLAGVFGEALGGILSDRRGRVATLKTGVFVMSLAALALGLVRRINVLPFLMLLWGLGWTLNHAGLSTFLTDLDKRFIKEVSSLNSSVRFLAGGLGVALGGLLMQKSFAAGFLIYAALFGIMFFCTTKILCVQGNPKHKCS